MITSSLLSAKPLTWFHSYDRARESANKTHKNLYVFIDADGCPYCERMRRNVLESPDVAHSLQDYVLLTLKINSADARKYFPTARVTPTSYFLDRRGKILLEFAGYTNEEFFFWRMADAERIESTQKKDNK
jgi:thioredoxin-related protein